MSLLSLCLIIVLFGWSLSAPSTAPQPPCPETDGVRALLKRLAILEKLVRDIKGQCSSGCCGNVQSGADDPSSLKPPDCAQTIEDCPGGCGGDARGTCVDGQCHCKDGYMGDKCQLRTCPEDCNDQGRCVKGRCICFDGFSGVSCGFKACPNNCHNHGRCEDGVCVCNSGFTGEDCSSRTCPRNCMNQGKCVEGACICHSGFSGPDCATRTCPKNCLNRGKCENGACVCRPGFSGEDCSIRGCPNNCQGRGDCEDGVCVCDTGFTGPDCGIRTCLNDCNGNGRCEDGVCVCTDGFYGEDCAYKGCPEDCNEQGQCINGKCICDPGFVGPDCGIRVCSEECEKRGRCEDGECICNPGFTGPDCDIRTCPNDCNNQGKCEDGQCICFSGYTGVDCKFKSCPNKCNNRGRCEDGVCICNSGFSGADCGSKACPKNCSGSGQCINGKCICNPGFVGPVCGTRACPAECTKHGRCLRGTCVCSPGYTGVDCSIRTCPKNCHERGRCEGGVCFCESGYTGLDCGTKTCPNNCYDRGHCEDGVCICDYGFTGIDCGTRTCSNDCHNRGRCDNGVCICEPGYTGQDCQSKTCPNDCHRRGKCEDGECVCDSGYTGLDCGSRTCPKDCNDQGRCDDGQCICDSGYTGTDCGSRTCPDDCNDRGSCDDGKCICHQGYSGQYCESRTCPNDCHKRGYCDDGICQCDPGYTDIDCGLKTCLNECSNQGQCDDGVCLCDFGYTGPDCSSRTCPENCHNQGRCDDGKCVCNPGFSGLDCGSKTCPDNCHAHGRCENGVCICNPGFTGPDCSSKACPRNCNNNGQCVNGKCVCNVGYSGPVCGARNCPGNCNGRGKCVNGVCVCKKGFSGPDCSLEAIEIFEVTGFHVISQEESSITLEWDQPPSAPDSYDIIFKAKKENGVISNNIDGILTTYRQTGLAPGEEYIINIQPRKVSTLGPETSITAKTKIETPRGLRVASVTFSALFLRWERPQSLPDRYIVTIIHPNGKERKLRVPGKGDRIKVTGLDDNTEYRVLLRAEKGQEQSQDTETTGTTAGEEKKTVTVVEKRIVHGPVEISHTLDTSVNLESSKQGKEYPPTLPRKELPNLREHKEETDIETITDKQEDINVLHTRKTIITTIYETHQTKGSRVDTYHEHEDFEYPLKMPTNGEDGDVITSMRGEEDIVKVKPLDKKGNLPSTKVDRVIIKRNHSHFEPSKIKIPVHLYEGEPEVSEEVHTITRVNTKSRISGGGRLPDTSTVAKKLLEYESLKPKVVGKPATSNSESVPQRDNLPHKVTYSAHENTNTMDIIKTGITTETSTESYLEPVKLGVKEDEDTDDLTDPTKSRKHITTLVRVNKVVNITKKKVGGREENNDMYNETTEGRARQPPPSSKPKNQSKIWSPQIKAVIENLPEKLSIYNGTFIQRLESYLRATSYPLRGNQTVESVARAIFLYLVKWKPHNFTDMVYDRLPQKTPGATTEPESVGESRLQGTKTDNRMKYGESGESQEQDSLVRRPDSARTVSIVPSIDTLGRVEAAGDINVPVIVTVDKYRVVSKEVDDNLIRIGSAPASKDNINSEDDVDSSRTSKPTADKITVPKKKVPPSKKVTIPKQRAEDRTGKQTLIDRSNIQVETGTISSEYEISRRTVLESTSKETKEKKHPGSRTGSDALKVDDVLREHGDTLEHGTGEPSLGQKIDQTTEKLQEHPQPQSKPLQEKPGGRRVPPRTQPSDSRKKFPQKPPKVHEVEQERTIHNAPVDRIVPELSQIPTQETTQVTEETYRTEDKSSVINQIPGFEEETGPIQSPIVPKFPSPGAQGRPSIQQRNPTSLVISLEGLGFIWDKAVIIYSPWPLPAGTTPRQIEVERGVRQVEISDLVPGTSYRFDLHGMLRGRSSKSYSLVADTAPLTTTSQPYPEVTTHLPYAAEVTTAKATKRPPGPIPPMGGLQVQDVTSTSVTLIWKARPNTFESFLIRYEDVTENLGTKETTVPGDQREVTLQDLTQNTRYAISLYGIRGGKLSRPLKEEVTTEPSPDRGTPPRLSPLSVSEVQPNSFRVSWEPLDGDFDAYVIQYGPPGGPAKEETLRGDETTYLFTGLVAEVNYTVELRGILGDSYSKPESTYVFTEKPKPPRLESISVSDVRSDSVHLTWDVSGGDFDTFLLFYRDGEGQPREIDLDNDLRSYDVKELKPGKKYKFVLYGLTGGKKSKPVTAETSTEKMMPPRLESFSVSDIYSESVRLSWEVTIGEFDTFLLMYRDAEGKPKEVTLDKQQRSIEVENLKPAKRYKFILYGISGGKKSKASIVETTTVPRNVAPSATSLLEPRLVDLVASDVTQETITLSWRVEGNVLFDSIIVQCRDPDGRIREIEIAGEDTSTIVQGLLPASRYECNVYGLRGEKRGMPLSIEVTTARILERQGPPTYSDLYLSPHGPHAIDVSWEAPEGAFDSFIVQYSIQGQEESSNTIRVEGTKRAVLISGLQPDTVYTVKLHRIVKGEEDSSLEGTGKTGPLDLEPPRSLRFSNIGETSAVTSWDSPNPETTTFKVSYQLADGGEPESISVVGTTTPLKRLIPGTHYEVTVVSVRGFEESQPLTDFFTTAGGGPRSLRAHDVTEVSALMRWEAPTGPVDRYMVTYRAENIPLVTVPVSGDKTELLLTGLHPHTEYFVSVQSSHGSMTSAPTSTSFITSADTPRDLTASQITARSALLTWKAPDAMPDGYLLTYQTPEGDVKEIRLLPHLSSFTLSQLNPTTQYRVQLKALQSGTSSAPISTSFTTGRLRFPYPRDCWEQRMNGEVQNGTFTIYLGGDREKMLTVFCDMESDGGGWMVFQRRVDGRTDFYRDWNDYRKGFGNMTAEFWLGNTALHQISSSGSYELRVDLRAGAESAFAVYDDFRVESEDNNFRLRLGQYRGNAGDSMSYHNNMIFSTRDRDAQKRILPCAMSYRGAWWYRNCHYANLNGLYNNNKDHQGVNWKTWKGFEFSIPFTEMKMRPRGVGNRRRL
ncbi:tenascin-X isoform X1 [Dendropsophus ebraccatus]|uniref:tenascin-X isoform X1 n=1 Tax=Dendropsophus ebraccatus TaxID=150705 RepID=UPI00383140BC